VLNSTSRSGLLFVVIGLELKGKEKEAVKVMEHVYASLLQSPAAKATAEKTAARCKEVMVLQKAGGEPGEGAEGHAASSMGELKSKPLKTCVGCGLQAPTMQRCGR